MKKLVGKLLEVLLIVGAVATLLGSLSAAGLLFDGLTTWAGDAFALSRLGLVVAIVAGGVYLAGFVDWSGHEVEAKPAPSSPASPPDDVIE